MSETGTAVRADDNSPSYCCTGFYEQDWVRDFAEGSFHPGGADLTRRTVEAMALHAGAAILDLGCGIGTTTRLLGEQFPFRAIGLDLSQRNIELAREMTEADNVGYVNADVGNLPFDDDSFDGCIAECVLSILGDKPRALQEIRRVLKVGGNLAVTDMSLPSALPSELAAAVEPWTCLADARDRDGYERLFQEAGLKVLATSDESDSLTMMTRELKRKLLLASAGGLVAGRIPFDIATIRTWLDKIDTAISAGSIRYLRFHLES